MNRVFFVFLAAICLSSCGSPFRKEWDTARLKPVPSGSIEGAWEGEWRSQGNGHHGRLRCIVAPAAGSERTFHYHAVWAKVFSGAFKVTHQTQPRAGGTAFTAKKELGRFGEFTAQGTITDQKFSARYQAVGDHGTFELERPR